MSEYKGCGCKAKIKAEDSRAEIWSYVFGKLTFPLTHPLPRQSIPYGILYDGDAKALTAEQRERLIKKMMEKFDITRKDITDVLDKGVLPIKQDNVMVSWCRVHSLAVL